MWFAIARTVKNWIVLFVCLRCNFRALNCSQSNGRSEAMFRNSMDQPLHTLLKYIPFPLYEFPCFLVHSYSDGVHRNYDSTCEPSPRPAAWTCWHVSCSVKMGKPRALPFRPFMGFYGDPNVFPSRSSSLVGHQCDAKRSNVCRSQGA